ncbi:ORF131 [Agrotis segetum granulovirus]|uniref:ORF131 n=1 Tax=Agrotis segetum granulosis virus TaxID=10464 RepID=Q6QXJ1_GVAS|nr:ORF131 [Agrotis segetum granulovirus]
MEDRRVMFLANETKEVINFLITLTNTMIQGGLNVLKFTPPCFKCKKSFKEIFVKTKSPYIFVVIKNWLSVEEEDVKFCCLDCCRELKMMDVVEISPTLSLHNIKKLMYNNLLKKFVFDFKESGEKKFRKHALVGGTSIAQVLKDIVEEKDSNEEIEVMELWRGRQAVVARDVIYDLRVDNGTEYNFDTPLSLSPTLISEIDKRLENDYYFIEVHYRVFEKYQPFTVYFNHFTIYECGHCRGKIHNHLPILSCSTCGFTDPNYWRRNKNMRIVPFWKEKYNYNKVFWKTVFKGKYHNVNLMLYNTNIFDK